MNFFERQDQARTLSRRFMWLFVLAVMVVVLAVTTVLLSVLAAFMDDTPLQRGLLLPDTQWLSDHAGLALLITLGVLGVIITASLFKTSQLSGGGGVVARAAGGMRVAQDTTDPQQRRLLNVVEEIAIASGVAVPAVYVLPQERGINAFAAGFNPSNAAIAVTRGTLELLDREELQGVIAHEFSHIVNGDMRLNIRLIGLLFGLTVIASSARGILRLTSRVGSTGNRKGGGFVAGAFLVAILVYAIGYLGLFFGRLIQAAVSRKREVLADACAVQFTRNPQGLRNALVKIGASDVGSTLVEADADAVAHLLFAPGMSRLFATHPPLEERIRAIDPQFRSSEFAEVRAQLSRNSPGKDTDNIPSMAAASATQRLEQLLTHTVSLQAATLPDQVGQLTPLQLALAQTIRMSLPDAVLQAAQRGETARTLLLALALDAPAGTRDVQLRFIGQQLGEAEQRAVQAMSVAAILNPLQRHPALLRLLPALRQLPSAERSSLLRCLHGLQQRGGLLSLNQFCLRKLAQVQLLDLQDGRQLPQRMSLPLLRAEATLLLAVLAQHGHDNALLATVAFRRGMQHLFTGEMFEFSLPDQWPHLLDQAFTRLDGLKPAHKHQLLTAMALTVLHDDQVGAAEVELIRTASACLHCPLPPSLDDTQAGDV